MNFKYYSVLIFFLVISFKLTALPDHIVGIFENSQNEYEISCDPQAHIDYGFSFPLTYKFLIPQNSTSIIVKKKYSVNEEWIDISKVTEDYYNHHEIFRVDETNNHLYVSVGFSNISDSIYLKATNSSGEIINLEFIEVTKYYDNRDAAMTASADDMASWSQTKFQTTIEIFLGYNLYLTLGMNTNGMNSSTYAFVQNYINTGFIEAGSHTRSHPGWAAYGDYDFEITGCKNDIINNLNMPELYRNGNYEYVYSFIAPNGYFDEIIDSLVGQNKMLVNRLYHDDFFDGFSEWNSESETFIPFTVTRAFDPPRSELGWGIGTNNVTDLNGKFDEVIEKGGVYHLMCHPNVMEWDKGYPWAHLEHISNRENIWYVSLGHLYLYHLAQTNYVNSNIVNVAENENVPTSITLQQNYPNPFNPETTIEYSIPTQAKVNLTVFNLLGQQVKTLVNEIRNPGNHSIKFNAENLNSGMYIYRLQVNSNSLVNKMIYLK